MRRILQKASTLFQRLHHEADVALFQVPNTAMHELGAAAGGAFAEVVLFQRSTS